MSKFAESLAIVRKHVALDPTKNPDPNLALRRDLDRLEQNYNEHVSELESRIIALKGQLSEARSARSMLVPLEKLWFDGGDGRRLIEDAFAHNPGRTRLALNYLGGSFIAGELRDQALAAEQAALPFV